MEPHVQLLALSSGACFLSAAGLTSVLGEAWQRSLEVQFGSRLARYRVLRMDEPKLQKALAAWGAGLTALLTGLLVVRAFPLAITLGYLLYQLPKHVLDHIISRRERLLEDQLVGVANAVGNGIKAGLSIPQAFENCLNELPNPIRQDVSRIVYHYQHGRVLSEVLSETRNRLQLEAFTLFALAIEVAIERGGRLNRALHRIGISLREWARLRRKVIADTAAGRQQVLILAVFPFLFLAFFTLIERNNVAAMFTTFFGQLMLSAIIALVYVGTKLAHRIINIKLG
ncbi:MAG: type II secretion system F family protein [Planctomycetaceae bacterium]